MKVTTEQYTAIRDAIQVVVDKQSTVYGPEHLAKYYESLKSDARVKDVDMRFRWDLFHAARLGSFVHELYKSGLNDAHIDTALKAIVRELNPLAVATAR